MLMAPREVGGKNLLDLNARNALQLMKLKTYLELDSDNRATWASLLDRHLQKIATIDSRADEESLVNSFYQDWNPNERKRPKRHRAMLKCAKKYGVEFDLTSPSCEILGKMPLWHHSG
jgi:hypothetical protein